jgi:hypothetical protein
MEGQQQPRDWRTPHGANRRRPAEAGWCRMSAAGIAHMPCQRDISGRASWTSLGHLLAAQAESSRVEDGRFMAGGNAARASAAINQNADAPNRPYNAPESSVTIAVAAPMPTVP